MGRFLESMGCVAAYAACLGIAVIGVGCGGESVGEQIRGGNGGTGGVFVVPESVDSTCREFCANENEGSTCGPSARPGSFNPGSSDVRQCYERCLSGYEASTGVCRDEWIDILECHIDLECEDLFGDCDSVEAIFNECVQRANNRDYCEANCPDFNIAQCEQDTTDCQAFAVANTYCDSICPTQEREQCIAQHIASGTCDYQEATDSCRAYCSGQDLSQCVDQWRSIGACEFNDGWTACLQYCPPIGSASTECADYWDATGMCPDPGTGGIRW